MKLLRVGLLHTLLLMLLITACDREPKEYTFPVAGSSGPLYQPPGRKPTVAFEELRNPYTATPERKAAIVGNMGRLKAGMSRQEVRAILGPPDRDDGTGTESIKVRLAGYSFTYTLHSRETLGGNTKDSIVQVSFDAKDRLRIWWSDNVPELESGVGEEMGGLSPEHTASPDRRAQIVAGVLGLHRGMSGADVTAIFGRPDSVWHLGTDEEAKRCDYAFYKCESSGVYRFDGEISVYFDAQEHPVRWEAKDVRELASKGGEVKAAATTSTRPAQ